jgi:hypothetical protein
MTFGRTISLAILVILWGRIDAFAQFNPTAIVHLSFSEHKPGCTLSLSWHRRSTGEEWMTQDQAWADVEFSQSFLFGDRGNGSTPNFDIDSAKGLLVGLQLSKSVTHYSAGQPDLADGASTLRIRFEPIPYTVIGNKLVVTTRSYACVREFESTRGCCQYGDIGYYGNCTLTDSTSDSLSLEITPAQSAVDGLPRCPLSIWYGKRLLATQNECRVESIEIYNSLGNVVRVLQLDPGELDLHIPVKSFSPGIYFIRAGRQLTKLLISE